MNILEGPYTSHGNVVFYVLCSSVINLYSHVALFSFKLLLMMVQSSVLETLL